MAGAAVPPNPIGEIDCNGLSPIQAPAHPTAARADPRGAPEDGNRAEDNDHYIGQSFGGDAQYGQVTFNPPGAFTSAIQRNPRCEERR